jgi:tRNA threonylcarbamoyladenosine biosynthesis protein TsaE
MDKQVFHSQSLEETQQIAAAFAKNFEQKGGIILFTGELGAGKTSFTQGFIKHFGISNKVVSPTFLLQKQYEIQNTNRFIFHLDLYRLSEPVDLKHTGIEELFQNAKDNIILIEWSEKMRRDSDIPQDCFRISLTKEDENKRKIEITQP